MSAPPPAVVRTTVYLPRELHRRLRSALALRGESVSAWIVRMATREIARQVEPPQSWPDATPVPSKSGRPGGKA